MGLARGGEDGARVVLEHREPGRDICGVVGARVVGDAEVGEYQAAEDFHRAFFGRVSRRPKAAAQITVEAVLRAGGVTKFISSRPR